MNTTTKHNDKQFYDFNIEEKQLKYILNRKTKDNIVLSKH